MVTDIVYAYNTECMVLSLQVHGQKTQKRFEITLVHYLDDFLFYKNLFDYISRGVICPIFSISISSINFRLQAQSIYIID